MKLSNPKHAALLALAGLSLLTTSAHALNDYDAGDLLLGVRATAGTGNTHEVIVNLGPASNFSESASAETIVTNANSAIAATFGANWRSQPRTDVFWSISGTTGASDVGSDPARTLYATKVETVPGALVSPWTRQPAAVQTGVANKMSSLATAYNNGTLASGAVTQLKGATNSYSSFQPGGTPFGNNNGISYAHFNPSVEGTAAQRLQLFRLQPGTSGSAGVFVGVLYFNNQGTLKFLPAGLFSSAGNIAFELPAHSVNEGSSITIPVVRTGGVTGAIGFTVATNSSGHVAPATAGADYTAPAVSGTMANGVTTANIVIPTLVNGTAAELNETFSVVLSAPTGGASLGSPAETVVKILEVDATKPTVVSSTPLAGINILTGNPLITTGTASDGKGVASVAVTLTPWSATTGGSATGPGTTTAATLGTPVASGTASVKVPFSASLGIPADGIYQILVTATDDKGNVSTPVSKIVTISNRNLLTLTRTVPSGFESTSDNVGIIIVASTPIAGNSTFTPAGAHANPKSSKAVPGTAIKLTATPKAGYAFSHWTGLPAGGTTSGAVMNFVMPLEDVNVGAVFVANPNLPAAGASSNFYGLIHPSVGVPSVDTEGLVTAMVIPTTGGLSGKILIGNSSLSFSGSVFGNGSVLFKSGTSLVPALTIGGTRTLTMSYNAGSGNDQLTVTLTNSADSSTSTGVAKRGIYSTTNLVGTSFPDLINAPGTTAAMSKGIFTVGLPSKAQTPTKPENEYPQGDGYLTITLSNTGTVMASGVLADGTSVTSSTGLVAGNELPVFGQLAEPGQAASVKNGVFLGTLVFDTSEADSDVEGTDLLWFRPAVTEVSGTSMSALATQRYTAGWPLGIAVDAVGALYDKSLSVDHADSLNLGAADGNGNGVLEFTGGKLVAPPIVVTAFNVELATATTTKVTKIPATNGSFSLILTQSTGSMGGTFTPDWSSPAVAKPAFKGILIQKGANKGGFGHFISNAVGDTDQEVGAVTLSAQP